MLWVTADRALRLSEKRSNLPCPDRASWLSIRDEIYEEIMQRGYIPYSQVLISRLDATITGCMAHIETGTAVPPRVPNATPVPNVLYIIPLIGN
jgi:hypothetical protein